jgi:hypothetical protein
MKTKLVSIKWENGKIYYLLEDVEDFQFPAGVTLELRDHSRLRQFLNSLKARLTS